MSTLLENQIKQKVHRYYTAATEDYLKYYQSDWHHHMHYGFERDLPKGGNPTENLVKYMAKIAGIKSHHRLLDAGCGVGGSAIWLSQNIDCQTVGITLMEMQAHLAHGFAQKKALKQKAKFVANDFTTPAFKPQSFDFIWATESFDHAPDKAAWIKIMFGLLKPGGRLIVADGFKSGKTFSLAEENQYAEFLKGWAVPHLASCKEFHESAVSAGFKKFYSENISNDIFPHAFAIYRFGLLFTPIRWLLHKIGLTSAEKLGNAIATYYQYHTLKKNLWAYWIFCYEKQL